MLAGLQRAVVSLIENSGGDAKEIASHLRSIIDQRKAKEKGCVFNSVLGLDRVWKDQGARLSQLSSLELAGLGFMSNTGVRHGISNILFLQLEETIVFDRP